MLPDEDPPEREPRNPWGAGGTRKCHECRRAKQKCRFRGGNPDLSCSRCHNRGLPCGRKEWAPRRRSVETTHPSPHQGSSTSPQANPPVPQDGRVGFLESVGITLSQELLERPLPPSLQRDPLSTIVLGLENRYGLSNPLQTYGVLRDHLIRVFRTPATPQTPAVQPTTPQRPSFLGRGAPASAAGNNPFQSPPYPQNTGMPGSIPFPQNRPSSNAPPTGYPQPPPTDDQSGLQNFLTPGIFDNSPDFMSESWYSQSVTAPPAFQGGIGPAGRLIGPPPQPIVRRPPNTGGGGRQVQTGINELSSDSPEETDEEEGQEEHFEHH